VITLHAHCVECVEFACPRRLFEDFVDCDFEIRVIRLEEVFEKEGKKLACSGAVRGK
jgi:hypothetical protein